MSVKVHPGAELLLSHTHEKRSLHHRRRKETRLGRGDATTGKDRDSGFPGPQGPLTGQRPKLGAYCGSAQGRQALDLGGEDPLLSGFASQQQHAAVSVRQYLHTEFRRIVEQDKT